MIVVAITMLLLFMFAPAYARLVRVVLETTAVGRAAAAEAALRGVVVYCRDCGWRGSTVDRCPFCFGTIRICLAVASATAIAIDIVTR